MIRMRIPSLSLTGLAVAALVLAGCGSGSGSGSGTSDTKPAACAYPSDGRGASRSVHAPPGDLPADAPTSMVISTSAGDIPITFDASAPCTVNSFISLAQQGFYDNTPCHRELSGGDYILQCGDPTGTGTGGPGYTIPDELVSNDPRLQPCDQTTGTCRYPAGALAMANTGQPNSGGSQFFLMYDASPFPPNYTVFATTDAAGLKVLKAIGAKGVAGGATDGPPATPVTITGVK